MLLDNKDWGSFEIVLDQYLKEHDISKNKISAAANLQRTQLNSYCKNAITRPDLNVLARICCVLKCEINDILLYVPPKVLEETTDE